MGGNRDELNATRVETNTSLDVERTAASSAAERTAQIKRRLLDNLIERDRQRVDDRLFKYRVGADARLARERLASPGRSPAVEFERCEADLNKEAEREVTDGLLDRERERYNATAQEQEAELRAERVERQGRERDTDSKLGAERSYVDTIKAELTESSLPSTTSESSHYRDVLAMVSHDLRSPLTVISLSAAFLRKGVAESDSEELVEDIVQSAERMERLLADLLDLARAESGVLGVDRSKHDIGELLSEVYRLYRPLFANRDMSLTIDEPALPLYATFDHDRIVQVLSNLLGNALKFAQETGGTAALSVCRREGDIEFEVRDNGPGIESETLPHIFEKFWQSGRDDRRGLGLGLYICQQIVNEHGGRLWVESVLGVGSTFRFTIPA